MIARQRRNHEERFGGCAGAAFRVADNDLIVVAGDQYAAAHIAIDSNAAQMLIAPDKIALRKLNIPANGRAATGGDRLVRMLTRKVSSRYERSTRYTQPVIGHTGCAQWVVVRIV